MKVLIIEDEIPAANKLVKLLASIDASIVVQGICRSIEESVQWLQQNPASELILMDIELTDGKSFEIFEKVKITTPIIFITAYDEYAIKAIKLHALDYLLKPVTKPMLTEAINAARQFIPHTVQDYSEIQKLITDISAGRKPKKLAVNSREGISFIAIDDILRLEADSNYTHIYLTDKRKITVPRTLKEYEETLSGIGFFRVHNTHIINLEYVDRYVKGEGGQVVMKDGTSIEVSQLRKRELMAALMIE